MAYQYVIKTMAFEPMDEFYITRKPCGAIDRVVVVVYDFNNEDILTSCFFDNESSAYQWMDEEGYDFDGTDFFDTCGTMHKLSNPDGFYDEFVDVDYKLVFAKPGIRHLPY